MFKGSYQKKLLTVLYSGGSNPLEIWDIKVKNGWTRRVKDEDMGTIVFEIAGTNVATAFIVSPPDPKTVLGITLPFITMFIKNLKRYFTFEIQILDDKNMRRRFRFSNYQSTTKVRPFMCSVPLALKPGWNQMQLNLANFTSRAYGTNYMETQRVQIHANCRIRRIYFSDRLYTEEELPRDYRIYLNVRQSLQTQAIAKVASLQKQEELEESLKTAKTSILKRSSMTMHRPSDIAQAEIVVATTSFKSSPSQVEEHLSSESKKALQTKSEHVVTVKSHAQLEEIETRLSGLYNVRGSHRGSEIKSTQSQGEKSRSVSFLPPREGLEQISEEPQTELIESSSEKIGEKVDKELIGSDVTPAETDVKDEVETESPRTEPPESDFGDSDALLESDVEQSVEAADEASPLEEANPPETEVPESPKD